MKGLSHPWSLAFLPNGDILVTERNAGRLRIVRSGVLDPQPISGVPVVYSAGLAGLMEVVLHPRFADNRLVYLSYIKGLGEKRHTPALVRGRLEGMALVDVKELFVADTPGTGPAAGAAMTFGPDGHLYMVVGGANDAIAQRTNTHQGKILRFRDDGSVPPDNPFVGKADSKPEIWSFGHRNMVGLTVHPDTGEIWESENGPQGGDEINIIKKGANYGWPLVSYGREYGGPRVSRRHVQRGYGVSVDRLDPVDSRIGVDVLHRRPVSELAAKPFRRWHAVRKNCAGPANCIASSSTRTGRRSGGNRCSWNCVSASGTCARAPMACSTC